MILTSDQIINFLNQLPLTSDRKEWIEQLLAALHILCPDVDRFSIDVNLFCNPFSKKEALKQSMAAVRFTKVGDKKHLVITPIEESKVSSQFESEIGKFVNLSEYHPPKFFHYFDQSGDSLGSLTLLRSKNKPPIDQQTLGALAALEPFMKFILASFIAMQNYGQPFTIAFRDAIFRMQEEAGFSEQEQKVVALKLAGYSYKMIAAYLDISLNTVRSHIKAIHRKTGTRSYTELFAKYFTPIASEFLP